MVASLVLVGLAGRFGLVGFSSAVICCSTCVVIGVVRGCKVVCAMSRLGSVLESLVVVVVEVAVFVLVG